MPLKKVSKKAPIAARKKVAQQNIEKLISEGYNPKQAAAIAYKQSNIPRRKKK